jgi:hypothetical protein
MESSGACVLRPTEWLSRTPDAMQDNGELSGQRPRALPAPDRLAIACAQSFKLEALFNRVRTTPAASYTSKCARAYRRTSISCHCDRPHLIDIVAA